MKYIRLFGLLGLLLGLMVAAVGCSSVPEALETEADLTGFITEIHSTAEEGMLGQILVESHADKLVDEYVVTIKDETLIFKQEGENRRQVAFETLETTQQMQIWFSGPILESFPVQGTAQQIVVFSQQHRSTSQTSDESAIRSPYVGQEARGIKALSQDDVEGLLAGAGSPFGGMAKPAELNGYPGPRHVLDAVKAVEFELTD